MGDIESEKRALTNFAEQPKANWDSETDLQHEKIVQYMQDNKNDKDFLDKIGLTIVDKKDSSGNHTYLESKKGEEIEITEYTDPQAMGRRENKKAREHQQGQ